MPERSEAIASTTDRAVTEAGTQLANANGARHRACCSAQKLMCLRESVFSSAMNSSIGRKLKSPVWNLVSKMAGRIPSRTSRRLYEECGRASAWIVRRGLRSRTQERRTVIEDEASKLFKSHAAEADRLSCESRSARSRRSPAFAADEFLRVVWDRVLDLLTSRNWRPGYVANVVRRILYRAEAAPGLRLCPYVGNGPSVDRGQHRPESMSTYRLKNMFARRVPGRAGRSQPSGRDPSGGPFSATFARRNSRAICTW